MASIITGFSPYDMARLADEYPLVFESYMDLFAPKKATFRERRAHGRQARVNRIFNGNRKHRAK